MKDANSFQPPPRLASEQGALGELVRSAVDYQPTVDQGAAFARLIEHSRGARRQRWSVPALAFSLATICVLAVALGLFGLQNRPTPREADRPAPNPEQVLSSAREFVLPTGETELDDGTLLRIGGDASARVETSTSGSRVALESGTVTLEVPRQTGGQTLEVRAKNHRFVVLGTVFSVSASTDSVALSVREGRVAVFRGETRLAEVGAGETWSHELENAGVAAEPDQRAPTADVSTRVPAPQPARSAERAQAVAGVPSTNCLGLARERRTREAERCFEEQAAGGGLGAEMALFELSRLRSDVLGDPKGALSALNQYRSRFAGGSLRAEVDISYLHLLAHLGRHGELLAESAKVLETPKGRERSAELRMMRGHTFRTALNDLRSAEREYAEVERAGGRFAPEALFYRGVCQQGIGNGVAAAASYRRYLEVSGRPREAEARRRLNEVGP